jgi:NAD(P)-dependent dehydrogenase (short-subunit alcohol dehydrogenase family)/uncharacterized OB-fold protein
LVPPPRKDPQARTRRPLPPPAARSRAALGLVALAAEGRFGLQACRACGHLTYPPRDACDRCLSVDLTWQECDPRGQLLAETRVHVTNVLYFRERMPMRVATVRLDAGPCVLAHVHGECAPLSRVRMALKLDRSGQAVLLALPEEETPTMRDDPLWRELTADPRLRRALVTDARGPVGQHMVRALLAAGARTVFAGIAEPWRPFDGQAALAALPGVEIVPLDVTDSAGVRELAGQIGGKVDILVNTAEHVRDGGLLSRDGVIEAKDAFDVNCFGMIRLAQAFGPGMRARGADGVSNACAFVNIISVYALANLPPFGSFSASQAALLSLTQCLRAELRPGGVAVMNVLTGPIDDQWRQQVDPPKVAPAALAEAVIHALREGLEDSTVGDVARDVLTRWKQGPKVLERELST